MFDRVLIMPLDYLIYFAVVLRGIHQKIDICQMYICSKLRIFPYSELTHVSTKFKLKKRQATIEFNVFVFRFSFFIPFSQTISMINRNDMYYFLHAWANCEKMDIKMVRVTTSIS